MVGGLQEYQQRVAQHLLPCVGQFIVALNDDAQWKNVNYQILLRSRHAHSQVHTHNRCTQSHTNISRYLYLLLLFLFFRCVSPPCCC